MRRRPLKPDTFVEAFESHDQFQPGLLRLQMIRDKIYYTLVTKNESNKRQVSLLQLLEKDKISILCSKTFTRKKSVIAKITY